jgi:hypothetical protein
MTPLLKFAPDSGQSGPDFRFCHFEGISMQKNASTTECSRAQRAISVLWPSFLIAAITTTLYFMVFDPREVWAAMGVPPLGVYTMAFFIMWTITASSSALTCYFQRPCGRVAAR